MGTLGDHSPWDCRKQWPRRTLSEDRKKEGGCLPLTLASPRPPRPTACLPPPLHSTGDEAQPRVGQASCHLLS